MSPMNIPPQVGTEEKYIAEAIANHKIFGDNKYAAADSDGLASLPMSVGLNEYDADNVIDKVFDFGK